MKKLFKFITFAAFSILSLSCLLGLKSNLNTSASAAGVASEFTNNGQFTYTTSGCTASLLSAEEAAAEGVSGAIGTVLKTTGGTDGTHTVSLDFTAANISLAKIEKITFRVYAKGTATSTYPEFRLQDHTSASWEFMSSAEAAGLKGAGGFSLASKVNSWFDVVALGTDSSLSKFGSSSDSSILGIINIRFRKKNANNDMYLNSVKVLVDDSIDVFTCNGQFTYVNKSSTSLIKEGDASAEGLSGHSGSVLKFANGTNDIAKIDYSASKIPLNLVDNITFRIFAKGTASGKKPELRMQIDEFEARGLTMWPIQTTGDGGISLVPYLNAWIDIVIDNSAITSSYKWLNFSDASDNTLLGYFNLIFRCTASSDTMYVDSITLNLKSNDNVAPVITCSCEDSITVPQYSIIDLGASAFDVQDNRNIPVAYIWTGNPTFDSEGKITSKGTYTLTLKAVDYYGNVATKTISVTVGDADNEAPIIALPWTELHLLTGTVFNPDFSCYITDAYSFTYTVTYSTGTKDYFDRLLVGTHTVTIVATDSSGNQSNKVLTLIVTNDYTDSGTIVDEEQIENDNDYAAVELFCVTYLGKGTIEVSNNSNTGHCLTAYASAKAAYNLLTNSQKNIFLHDNQFSDMYLRMCAWATANGETFTSTGTFANSKNVSTASIMNITYIFISISALILMAGVSILLKKKFAK